MTAVNNEAEKQLTQEINEIWRYIDNRKRFIELLTTEQDENYSHLAQSLTP